MPEQKAALINTFGVNSKLRLQIKSLDKIETKKLYIEYINNQDNANALDSNRFIWHYLLNIGIK